MEAVGGGCSRVPGILQLPPTSIVAAPSGQMHQRKPCCHPFPALSLALAGARSQKRHTKDGRSVGGAIALAATMGDLEVKNESSDDVREVNEDEDGMEAEVLKRQGLFNRISPVYDSLNDWMSLGLHRVWKRMSVSWSGAKSGDTVLDICCGSGDISFLLAEAVASEGKVLGLDFAAEQLATAASRQQDLPRARTRSAANIEWIQGDALALPFETTTFDAITMGYGLRNVTDIPKALAEIHRVLKSGRRAAILDFNHSANPVTDGFQSWMLDNVVVPVATSLGVEQEYAYLKSSIARFPLGSEQERLAVDAGFSKATHYEVGGGLMGILVLIK